MAEPLEMQILGCLSTERALTTTEVKEALGLPVQTLHYEVAVVLGELEDTGKVKAFAYISDEAPECRSLGWKLTTKGRRSLQSS